MKNKLLIYVGTAVVLLGAFVAATMVYEDSQKEKLSFLATENAEVFVRKHSPRYGNPEAKVVLIEFLDPECESCRAFYPSVKGLLTEFDNKVQLVVRYAPFHSNSVTAIKALEAARFQDKYWDALELLFYYQPEWGDHHNPKPELMFEYLKQLDLDMDLLKADMEAQKIQAIIEQDKQDLRTLNVRATPTFFVNGMPLEDFSEVGLRRLLQKAVDEAYP